MRAKFVADRTVNSQMLLSLSCWAWQHGLVLSFGGRFFLNQICCGIEDGAEAKALSSAWGTSTPTKEQKLHSGVEFGR